MKEQSRRKRGRFLTTDHLCFLAVKSERHAPAIAHARHEYLAALLRRRDLVLLDEPLDERGKEVHVL